MKPDKDFEDDGRTIAPMDVDGIRDGLLHHRRKRPGQKDGTEEKNGEPNAKQPEIPLTKREAKLVTRGIWLAYAVTGLIFLGFFALFFLFCQFVWFA